MKRTCQVLIVCLVAMSCSSARRPKTNICNENPDFKRKFFSHIATIEKYTTEGSIPKKPTISTDSITKAFQFISKYTLVSREIMGYNFGYFTIESFENDKKKWLEWYEANKCNNLR